MYFFKRDREMAENSSSQLKEDFFEKIRRSYPNQFLTDQRISLILDNCTSEQNIKSLFKHLSQHLKSGPDIKTLGNDFFENVDDSQYDMTQWIDTITLFDAWLDKENRTSTFKNILGYIQCCTKSPENKMNKYRLSDLLEEMLKVHGYIG